VTPSGARRERATAFACHIRRIVLRESKRANVGHIGSSLSVADLLAALYADVIRADDPDDPNRDRLVLSKGHAALALYGALNARGWVRDEQIATFCGDASLLGVHPEVGLAGVDFSTGSLGHGPSMGAGAALAARLDDSDRRVFVLVSDAECDEGSVWEAIMFAAHHQLSNLIILVDMNGQQALGYTDDVLSLSPMGERWRAFGWDVHEIDGHDVGGISEAIAALNTRSGPPHVLLARTTFGRGVSYMENKIKWHYWPMSDDDYRIALAELEAQGCAEPSSPR